MNRRAAANSNRCTAPATIAILIPMARWAESRLVIGFDESFLINYAYIYLADFSVCDLARSGTLVVGCVQYN